MHKFKDVDNNEWVIQLDTHMARSLRKELGVDLLNLDEETISKLSSDTETLVDIISFICTDQIKSKDMDERKFAQCMVNDALDNASEALMQELVFISRRSRREIVAKAWEKIKAAEELMTARAMDMLDSGVVERKTEEAIQEMEAQLGNL